MGLTEPLSFLKSVEFTFGKLMHYSDFRYESKNLLLYLIFLNVRVLGEVERELRANKKRLVGGLRGKGWLGMLNLKCLLHFHVARIAGRQRFF